jgi:hypothetical protein
LGGVQISVRGFLESTKGLETYTAVVMQVRTAWSFQASGLMKRLHCLLMPTLLLEPASQKVVATRGWRLLQQGLEAINCVHSPAGHLQQTPCALELNVWIIWSDAENPLIRLSSSRVAVQAQKEVRQAVVKLRSRIAPDHHQEIYRRHVLSGPRLCSRIFRVAPGRWSPQAPSGRPVSNRGFGGQEQRVAEGGVVAEEPRSNPEAATTTEKSRAAVTTRLLNFGCGGGFLGYEPEGSVSSLNVFGLCQHALPAP